MRKAGEDDEAERAFTEFEKAVLAESLNVDNANRELTAYYIEEAQNPVEALRVANLEMANRQDWRTLYAHARALHANREFQAAQESMTKALAVGVMIPAMKYHAGVIAKDAGAKNAAKGFFESAGNRAVCADLKKRASEAGQAL
ncbi:MAG: hypothetical protein ACJAVK_000091 [Akkermansiaceae bacterium]|jgi:hypothetical protein